MKNWSKYNVFFNKGENYFLYCSLTNSFARLSKETYLDLRRKFMDDMPVEDEEIRTQLKHMKAIETDDAYELTRIRYMDDIRRFSRHSLSLTINPTLACNFRCPYCFEKEHRPKYMKDEVEDRIMELVRNSVGSQRIFVTWFGGEPLLGFNIIKSLTGKLKGIGKPYEAGMITNGYLLTDEVIKSLEPLCIRRLQITLDGRREIHDSRRHLADGGPTYDVIIKNIERCRNLDPKLRIAVRVNIDKTNKDDFIEIYKELISLNHPNIDIYPGIVQTDGEVTSSDIRQVASPCDVCDREEVIRFLVGLYNDHGLRYIDFFPKARMSMCTARNISSFVIGPEGEVYDCWNDVGDETKIVGKIGETASNMKLHLQYIAGASQFEDDECLKCVLLPVCNGGCQRIRIKDNNKKEKSSCMLAKDHLEDFLYMHYLLKRN